MRHLLALSLLACSAAAAPPATVPHPAPAMPRLEARVHYATLGSLAPDTLVLTASYALPADDGRGPVDSLRVRYSGVGFGVDTTVVLASRPFPTTATVRRILPAALYSGVGASATFDLYATVQVWRRGTFTVTESPHVPLTLNDAAPPGVTGLTFSAVKKP